MRKTKKRILGLLGLSLVVVTTVFAAFLPGPETSAVSSVTDTILVRVIGAVPNVEILSPENGSVFIYPNQSFSFDYENVEYIYATTRYTDKDGVAHEFELIDSSESYVDYNAGTYSKPLNLLADNYGYGEYQITVTGSGPDGVKDFADVVFYLYPVSGKTEENNEGLIYLDLYYDKDNENINTIGIDIYDEDGNLVKTISPIIIKTPIDKVELPFLENNLPAGNYEIRITAYNAAGEALYNPYVTYLYYDEEIPVPDSGSLFNNLNISKTDYLLTGLLIFFSVAGLGIIFIVKNNKKKTRLGKKRN